MKQPVGLWRGLFGWDTLFRWDVLGALVPGVFIAVGLGLLGIDWFPDNLMISQVCFSVAALMVITKTIGHAHTNNGSVISKVIFCVVLCGITLVIALFTVLAIQSHKPKLTAEKSVELAPQPGTQEPEFNSKTEQSTAVSPLDELTKLGWVVIADSKNGTRFNFQEASKPLPDMRQSAKFMKMVRGRFTVGIIEAKSLDGLSNLGSLKNLEGLTLAGNFGDLAEVRAMKLIRSLDLVGLSARDLGPVGTLVQLRELTLQQFPGRPLDVSPLKTLANLRKLTITQFLIQNLSALRGMTSLSSLDLTGSIVGDLSSLREVKTLSELSIDQQTVPNLSALTDDPIKALHIRHSEGATALDLTPVTNLGALETVDIVTAGTLMLSPLRRLPNLKELTIMGTAISFRDSNYSLHLQDPATIGEMHGLKKLGLSWLDIQDTEFLRGLNGLEEIYINQTPVSDVRALGTLESLRSVQFAGTRIADISPLLNLPKLKTLNIQATPARLDIITELRNRGVMIK